MSDFDRINKSLEEFNSKFFEAHHSLSSNIKKCKKKKEKLHEISSQRIKTFSQMIDREKQLTLYASELMAKQKAIKHRKKHFFEKIESQNTFISEQYDESMIQLNLINQRKSALDEMRRNIQISHQNLSFQIEASSGKFDTILRNEKVADSTLNNNSLRNIQDINERAKRKIDHKKARISEMNDAIIDLNAKIIQTNMKLANVKIDNQSMITKIRGTKAKYDIVHKDVKSYQRETQKKQNDYFSQLMEIKKEETKLTVAKNTIEARCESLTQKISVSEEFALELNNAANEQKEKVCQREEEIKSQKEETKKIKQEKSSLLENMAKKKIELEKGATRISGLQKEVAVIKQQKQAFRKTFQENTEQLNESLEKVEQEEPLVEEYSKMYDAIDDAEKESKEIEKLLESVQNQKGPNISEFEEVIAVKKSVEMEVKPVESEIVAEKAEKENVENQVKAIEKNILLLDEEKMKIQNAINQEKTYDDLILAKLNGPPTVENVSQLIDSFVSKRKTKIDRFINNNKTLEKRLEETSKRINLRKRKLKRQAESLEKQVVDIGFAPDEEKLGLKSIQSFTKCINEENVIWKKSEGMSLDVLLYRWEKQMDGLYDELDEFFLR